MKHKEYSLLEKAWRNSYLALIICSIITLPLRDAFSYPVSNPADIFHKAHVKKQGEFLAVYLNGPPYEMGYQHGVLLKKEIRNLWNDYFINTLTAKYAKSSIKKFLLVSYFKWKSLQYQKYISQDLKDEIAGIAQGSGLSYATILTMHTFLDTMALTKKEAKSCTNFVLMPEITEEGKLYHARNLGFAPSDNLNKNKVIFFFEPERGVPFVSIGWPGMCGVLSGMNMNGISISETSVGTAEVNKRGVPLMLLLREIVQYADNIDFAIKKITSAKMMCGYTVTVTEDNKKATVVECTGKRYNIVFPENRYLISVNHYLSPELFETMKPVYKGRILEDTSSYKRLMKFREFIKSKDKFSLGDIQALLRTPPLSSDNLLQSIVFAPQERKFTIYSEQDTQWLAFSLMDEFAKYELAATEPINLIGNTKITPQLQSTVETKYYTKLTYRYLPEGENRLPDRSIWLYLYLPKGGQRYPLVLFLPHSVGVSYIERNIGKFVSENGFAFLTLETGYQKEHGKYGEFRRSQTKLETAMLYLDMMKELIVESQNILDWTKGNQYIDSDRVCVGGLSLGSIVSEVVVELRDDVHCGLFLLGGGDLDTIFLQSTMFKDIRAELVKNKELASELLRYIKFLDPLNLAYTLKNKRILMCNALFDTYVPKECTLKLWRAAGYPPLKWLISGHITAIFSLGFVENEMMAFLKWSLKHEESPVKIKKLKFSAPTGEEANLRYEHKNNKVIFNAKYSSNEKGVKVGFEQQDIFDTPLFFGLDFNGRWESDDRYRLKPGLMSDAYLGFWATRITRVKLGFSSYQYEIFKLSDTAPSNLKDFAGRPRTDFLNLDILRETTNDKFYPTEGTSFDLNYNLSGKSLGSDSNFYRIQTEYKRYYDLGKKRVFAVRTKGGYEAAYGDSNEIPYFEEFFLGGSGTVRGYRGRKVGPLDSDLLPLGGKFYEVMNFEYRFPLYRNWYGALFFDEGSLVDKVSNFGVSDIKYGTGFGFRYKTPWGFGRIDLGFKIGPDKDRSRFRPHATFGLPF